MKIDILTIFPEQIECFTKHGIFRIAQENGNQIKTHDIRDWSNDKHRRVDDRPFGGGAGMVLKIGPIYRALQDLKSDKSRIILTTPKGDKLTQKKACEYSNLAHLIIIAGHYEGVDYRVQKYLVDEVISVGDYVLSGGELPALTISDAILRNVSGVLGNPESLEEETFEEGIEKEYPQYTRPENFKGWKVPPILLSGDHKKIDEWRKDNTGSL